MLFRSVIVRHGAESRSWWCRRYVHGAASRMRWEMRAPFTVTQRSPALLCYRGRRCYSKRGLSSLSPRRPPCPMPMVDRGAWREKTLREGQGVIIAGAVGLLLRLKWPVDESQKCPHSWFVKHRYERQARPASACLIGSPALIAAWGFWFGQTRARSRL